MADRAKVYDLQEYREKREARDREASRCELCGWLPPHCMCKGRLVARDDGKLCFVRAESVWGVFPDV